ncbi:GDSL-type esterase/lipase family protein [Sphingomonas sp.]|uniref:GDSL-type esterase/lipase family protein n=1 Tax=Sphingomonas sp. TaxID=28214 RepID=UPI0035C79FE6
MTNDYPIILALGDSLVAGYGLAQDEGLVAMLQRRLAVRWPRASVINAGVSGDTSADVYRRLPRLLTSLSHRPDLALVQVGPNDLLRGVAPAELRANLSAIVRNLSACGIPVLLTRVEPPPILRARAAPYQAIHADVARDTGAALCTFFPAGVLGHPDMVLGDRVHPQRARDRGGRRPPAAARRGRAAAGSR